MVGKEVWYRGPDNGRLRSAGESSGGRKQPEKGSDPDPRLGRVPMAAEEGELGWKEGGGGD